MAWPLRTLDLSGDAAQRLLRAGPIGLDAAHAAPVPARDACRLLAEVSFGTGALAVVGGTVGVICFLTFFTGTEVGLQGYQALNQIGSSAFTGFVSAYFNTREIAPLVAALALRATVGCGFTAQLGAMRISEEVDALEVMARAVAAVPGHHPDDRRLHRGDPAVRGRACSPATWPPGPSRPATSDSRPAPTTTTSTCSCRRRTCCGRSARCSSSASSSSGCTATTATPPAAARPGSGVAVGRAVRAAIVCVNVVDFFLSLAIWGATTTVRIAG